IDNHHTEIRHPGLDDLEQVLQPPSALDGDPGLPSIEEGANNAEIVSGSVKGNGCGLIGDRVLLMVGAHAHVFRGTKAHGRIRLLLPGSGIDGKVSHIQSRTAFSSLSSSRPTSRECARMDLRIGSGEGHGTFDSPRTPGRCVVILLTALPIGYSGENWDLYQARVGKVIAAD